MSETTRSSPPVTPPPNHPAKRRWLKRIIIAVVILLVIAGIVVALLPTYLSTPSGKSMVESIINKRLRGRVEMSDLKLAWGKGQSVAGFKLYDPAGKVALSIDRIEIPDTTLMSLVGESDLGTIRVVNMNADVVQTPDGKTNLQQALESPTKSPEESKPKTASESKEKKETKVPRGKFEVVNSNVAFTALNAPKNELKDISITVDAADPANVHITAGCQVFQAGAKAGSVDLNVTAHNAITPGGTLDIPHATYDATGSIANLPVAMIDTIAHTNGLLPDALGPILNATLKASVDSSKTGGALAGSFNLTAQTANLDVRLHGPLTPDKIQLDAGSTISLTVQQALLNRFTDPKSSSPIILDKPTPVQLEITKLVVPLKDNGPDLNNTAVTVAIKTTGIKVQNAKYGLIGLRDVSVAAQADELDKLVTVNADATLLDLTATTQPATQPTPGGTPADGTVLGKIASKTELRGLAFVNNKPQFDQLSCQTDTHADNIPVAGLDTLLKKNGELTEMLGPTTSLDIQGNYTPNKPNDIDVNLHGGNADLVFSGTLDKNMVLTLRKDATASMRVTPGLSKILLAKLNPILREAESGKDPIHLTINKAGFTTKAYPFDILTMSGDMKLDIGTIILHREGGFADQVMDFFVQMGTNIQPRQEFPAIFTTLVVQIRKGTISTNDLWFTTDRRDLTMGSKAVVSPRGKDWYADTVIGISADTFAQSKLIGGAINRDSVFEIRAKGPLDKLTIDPVKLATKMAPALLKSVKGLDVFSGLLDQAGKAVLPKDKSGPQFVTQGWPNKPKATESAASQPTNNTSGQQQQSDQTKDNSQQSPSITDQIQGLFAKPKKKKNNN